MLSALKTLYGVASVMFNTSDRHGEDSDHRTPFGAGLAFYYIPGLIGPALVTARPWSC